MPKLLEIQYQEVAAKSSFGIEGKSWYMAQEEIIGKNDISFIYALGGTAKEVMKDSYLFNMYAGKTKAALFVYELGFSSLTRDPLLHGDIHFGFGEDDVGMPLVSPVNETIYAKKYPGVNKQIQAERKRIIKKISGWDKLNTLI